jgi:hypothetical protein
MKLTEIEKGFQSFYPNGETCEFTAHAAAQICEVIMKPKNINIEPYVDEICNMFELTSNMDIDFVREILNRMIKDDKPISIFEA